MELSPPHRTREVKTSFLVFVTSKAEYEYVEWVSKALNHPLLAIRKLDAGVSDEEAIRMAAGVRRKELKKGTPYDETWCVRNARDADNLAELMALGEKHKVGVAGTVPSFEAWLLSHFQDVDVGPGVDHAALLEQHLPELSTTGYESKLRGKFKQASKRAHGAHRITTTIPQLVQAILLSQSNFTNQPPTRI
jgi:hypothetical protein